MSDARARLAAKQRDLVRALVAGEPVPPGFDASRVAATSSALLNKRAGEVAGAWPRLAAGLGREFRPRFRRWAAGRPPEGSTVDGFCFAGALAEEGALPALGAEELAEAKACLWLTPERHLHYRTGLSFGRCPVASSDGGGSIVAVAFRGRLVRSFRRR